MIVKSPATMAPVAIGFFLLDRAGAAESADRTPRAFIFGNDPGTRRRGRGEARENGVIVAAARAWCGARAAGGPVQPALYEVLEPHRCGILAAVFAGLFAAYEDRAGKAIEAGGPDYPGVTPDEEDLLGLFDEAPGRAKEDRRSDLLRLAVHSSRAMMRLALEIVQAG
ncbi:MAG: hypothetical protein JWO81_3296 [Alphaproteobacteria bacterium]|nr:hypothetical protein [Alphaproteobacteria bacterium]